MNDFEYTLAQPIDAVIFDCDGTLSAIEGIEYLAEHNGVGERVRQLTQQAMSETGLNASIYQERIELVRPTRQQVVDLGQVYFANRVAQITQVIELLQAAGKAVFVVSAGVNPAVKLFAAMLEVPAAHVHAVDLTFALDGTYEGYDVRSSCTQLGGKKAVAQQIKSMYPRLAWVGDGMNDIAAKDEVARFIGFGGYFHRAKVAALSDFYLTVPSMLPLLPLVLTPEESKLSIDLQLHYNQGLAMIQAGGLDRA